MNRINWSLLLYLCSSVAFVTLACGGSGGGSGNAHNLGGGGSGGSGGSGSEPTIECTKLCNKLTVCGYAEAGCEVDCTNDGGIDPKDACYVCMLEKSCSDFDSGACNQPCNLPCSPFQPASCSGETICVEDACTAAFPRMYKFIVRKIVVGERVPETGECWDAGCGAPDLYATLYVNGTAAGSTSKGSDSYTFSPNEYIATQVMAGSSVELVVYDEDLTADDRGFSCVWNPLRGSDIRGRMLLCGDATNYVEFEVEPN